MNEKEPATTAGADAKETSVGSVFVSNYPPYSFWRSDQAEALCRILDRPPQVNRDFGLYLHIPFCRKRCKFCYFRVFTDKNKDDVQRYIDTLLREIEAWAATPALADRPLKFIYFGGGTPSFISARHMRKLVDGMKQTIPWDGVEEVTFECEPGTLTRPKLDAIREVGITRISLGVENFNDEILEENGRAHLSKEIYRVAPWIASLDFDQLNIDLIAGMVGETWDTWRDSVQRTLEMDPDSVTIYQMELPFNTLYSRRVLDGARIPVADWQTKRDWHAWAFEQFEAADYEISSAYTVVKHGKDCSFVYRDSVWRGCDMLGLGVSSFGHLGGVHYQNATGWNEYMRRVAEDGMAVERVYVPSPEESLIRETILQLKRGRLELEYFRSKFGADLMKEFPHQIEALVQSRMLEVDDGRLRLTRDGLLRVDQLLPAFYLPQHQNARYT
jgi:oxygen-independent coproporphyrinogen-3 oxidase